MSEDTHDDIHSTEGGTHHYENANVSVTEGSAWYESKSYKSFMAFVALVRWVVVALVFSFGVYLYQRDVNAQSTVSVADTAKEVKAVRELIEERRRLTDGQYNDLKATTPTTALVNAQFDALNKRLDRIEAALDRVSGRPYTP